MRPKLNERWILKKDWRGFKEGAVMLFVGADPFNRDRWLNEASMVEVVVDPGGIAEDTFAPLGETPWEPRRGMFLHLRSDAMVGPDVPWTIRLRHRMSGSEIGWEYEYWLPDGEERRGFDTLANLQRNYVAVLSPERRAELLAALQSKFEEENRVEPWKRGYACVDEGRKEPPTVMVVGTEVLDRLYVAVHGKAAEKNYFADGLVEDAARELLAARADALVSRENFDRHCAMSSNDDWSRRSVVAAQKAELEAELIACRRELRRMEKNRDEWRDKAKRIGRL